MSSNTSRSGDCMSTMITSGASAAMRARRSSRPLRRRDDVVASLEQRVLQVARALGLLVHERDAQLSHQGRRRCEFRARRERARVGRPRLGYRARSRTGRLVTPRNTGLGWMGSSAALAKPASIPLVRASSVSSATRGLEPREVRAEAVVRAEAERDVRRCARARGRRRRRARRRARRGWPSRSSTARCRRARASTPCSVAGARGAARLELHRRGPAQHLLDRAGTSERSARARRSCSGCASSSSTALPISVVVVSLPATSSRISIWSISSWESFEPSCSACTRPVSRSSRGWRRRSSASGIR